MDKIFTGTGRNRDTSRGHSTSWKFFLILIIAFTILPGFLRADIIGPYLQSFHPATEATICWQQDGIVESPIVKVGEHKDSLSLSATAVSSEVYKNRLKYCATFTNLKSGKRYYYSIPVKQKIYSFKTIPPGDTFRFAVEGDTRTGDNAHFQVISTMEHYDFTFYFNTGDMVYDNHLNQWDIFFNIEKPVISTHFFNPVEGNHDVGDDNILFSQLFYFPPGVTITGSFYSFWVKKNFFVVVSTEKPFDSHSYQYRWMEEQLKEANEKGAIHKFMFFHRPPFSSGFHGMEGIEEDRGVEMAKSILAPLAITYGVTVVFNGHDHCYERSYKDGVYFITTGGGGATPAFVKAHHNPYSQFFQPNGDLEHYHFVLVEVGKTYVDLKAITIANKVMDHLVIGNKPTVKSEKKEKNKSWGCSFGDGAPYEIILVIFMIGIIIYLFKKTTSSTS